MKTAAAGTGATGETLTVQVPMSFKRRGGQKLIVVPNGATLRPHCSRDESRLVKLLAGAFYWKQLVETSEYATLAELAAAEKVNKSYLSKVLRLTLLAPDIVEALLSGAEADALRIEFLLQPFPIEWEKQRPWLATEARQLQTCPDLTQQADSRCDPPKRVMMTQMGRVTAGMLSIVRNRR